VYFYGIFVAAFLIGGTIALAMMLQRVRAWWERRRGRPSPR
jgi:hypothetical protein